MATLLAISLNPNIGIKEGFKSLGSIFENNQRSVQKFEKVFAEQFSSNHSAVSFYSGRVAWYAILKAVGIQEGDEVLIPAFTCVAVVNPIRWLGAIPVYVDITDDFVMDLNDAKKKITSKTKVLLAQHTFGHVVHIEDYQALARTHGIQVIEDCAHALGSKYPDGSPVGSKSLASFYSFGRDKCITALSGGIAITANSDVYTALSQFQSTLKTPTFIQRLQDAFYPIVTENVLRIYSLSPSLGKAFHRAFLNIGIVKKANSTIEKKGGLDERGMRRWSEVYAQLALEQLNKLEEFTAKRIKFAHHYYEMLNGESTVLFPQSQDNQTYLRFAIQMENPQHLRNFMYTHHVILGDWYDQVVAPNSVDLSNVGYIRGSCPHAELVCNRVINLPTNPRMHMRDIQKIAVLVHQFLSKTE